MAKRLATTGDKLNEDLLTEVLLKLPTRSLLGFKSVSKSWLSLISSNRFAKSHLLTSLAAARDVQTFIVHLMNDEEGLFELFNLGSARDSRFPCIQDEYPFVPKSSRLVGCDCGILCVAVNVYDCHGCINKTHIYLWNPATKHSKRIPPHTILDNRSVALAFGFNHIDFDFKVVRIVSHNVSAEVYSSNKNAWRKIESNQIDFPHFGKFGVCLHGFLFGIGYHGMMAFDLNKEVFICNIKLPVSSSAVRISDFNNSVAVFMYNRLNEKVKLWTLNDEACLGGGGVEASWTMMLTIDLGVPLSSLKALFNSVEFFLIEDGGEWLVYNYINKETRYVTFDLFFEPREVFKYTESLVSI